MSGSFKVCERVISFQEDASRMTVGVSILVDVSGVRDSRFHTRDTWEKILPILIEQGGMRQLHFSSHQFSTVLGEEEQVGGTTAFALLAESHISVHTWPEFDKIVIDIFTCGETSEAERMVAYLEEHIPHDKMNIIRIDRGT